jgi:signal transduction histidine kinase
VVIAMREGERYVSVSDDGDGFDGQSAPAGQGLKNIRARAESIAGDASVQSRPGRGTTVEIALRA